MGDIQMPEGVSIFEELGRGGGQDVQFPKEQEILANIQAPGAAERPPVTAPAGPEGGFVPNLDKIKGLLDSDRVDDLREAQRLLDEIVQTKTKRAAEAAGLKPSRVEAPAPAVPAARQPVAPPAVPEQPSPDLTRAARATGGPPPPPSVLADLTKLVGAASKIGAAVEGAVTPEQRLMTGSPPKAIPGRPPMGGA